jgi:hypothetical protein
MQIDAPTLSVRARLVIAPAVGRFVASRRGHRA